jgi:hypothetical protein
MVIWLGRVISTRGPLQWSSTQQVAVKVGDGLTTMLTMVHDQSKSIFEPQHPGNLSGLEQQVSQQSLIRGLGVSHSSNGLLGNHQNVNRSLRVNIPEGQYLFVFVNDVSRNLTRNNFLKQGLTHEL